MATPDQNVNIAHGVRDQSYQEVLEQIVRDGKCPFCWENFLTYHTEPILVQTERWIVTPNFRPYAKGITHLLFVPKLHARHVHELPGAFVQELFEHIAASVEERNLPGYTLLMRAGDTDRTGGSVTHLHAQLISGGSRDEGGEPITPLIGYGLPPSDPGPK
jgi:diadenosine tetraphosphate (Ap4A) HIT family hydrolase